MVARAPDVRPLLKWAERQQEKIHNERLTANPELAQLKASGQTVRFAFQPAEEGGAGGKVMVDEGALEGAAAAFALISLTLATPLFWTFLETGTVPRLPTAVLSTGLMVLASLSVVCGLLLETASRSRREAKRMFYLAMPAVRKPSAPTTRAS